MKFSRQYPQILRPFMLPLACLGSIALLSSPLHAIEMTGFAQLEARYFTEYSEPQLSAASELEAHWQSETSNNSVTATVFARVDDTDDDRTKADIRELSWLYYRDDWEIQAGISKVFWGVTESAHRVDVINQTDGVESIDGEEKLGQPMVKFAYIQSWGTVEAFWLPYFRERTFNSQDGYLGFILPVDIDYPIYESDKEERHQDWALRYSHSVDIWDIGISYFKGTDREPILLPTAERFPRLRPYYTQIEQVGVDIQATIDAWLLKLETIHQSGDDDAQYAQDNFSAITAGFEYTLTGVWESDADIGILMEYHYNDEEYRSFDLLQNDLFIGGRLTLNDTEDSALLVGIVSDLDYSQSYQFFIEASRRVSDDWTVTLDARVFESKSLQDLTYEIRQADHISLDVSYYF